MSEVTDPVSDLFEKAKEALPFGEANDYGLEARLRAALSDQESIFDWVSVFSWRFSAAFIPIIVTIAVFYAWQQQWDLPDGAGDLVYRWAEYLPLEI
ncbi:hypothetical protein N9Z18_00345 [Verrucomicrobiales bacterium]|jgi:hypothetical protein|nr:hypothetical protein [Verrucomicrobiales bacterium]|tara:strand:+ start:147 stop:437 length:291 start_codon:yes stop_codon:yes gene_type:complete